MTYAALELIATLNQSDPVSYETVVLSIDTGYAGYRATLGCARHYGERDLVGTMVSSADLFHVVADGLAAARDWLQTWPAGTRLVIDLSPLQRSSSAAADQLPAALSSAGVHSATIVPSLAQLRGTLHLLRGINSIVLLADDSWLTSAMAALVCDHDERAALLASGIWQRVSSDYDSSRQSADRLELSRQAAESALAAGCYLQRCDSGNDSLYLLVTALELVIGKLYGSVTVAAAQQRAQLRYLTNVLGHSSQ